MFDIVIPIWKMKTKYLQTCLESLKAQTYADFKCFIIDGTPKDWEHYDKQMKMLQPYLNDNRFRYKRHKNKERPFVSEAMNQGAELGSNPFIQFLGGDDFFYSHHLSTMKEKIEKEPQPEKVGAYFCMVQKNQKRILDFGEFKVGQVNTYVMNHYLIHPFLSDELQPYFHSGNPILMNGGVFNRKAFEEVGGFDEDLVVAEDTDLVMKIIQSGYLTRWFPYIGAYLRVGQHQTTVDGDAPFDKASEFMRCGDIYNKRYADFILYHQPIDKASETLSSSLGDSKSEGFYESVWGFTNPKYKHLSRRMVPEKEAFFVLKTEDEVKLFMEGDIVL